MKKPDDKRSGRGGCGGSGTRCRGGGGSSANNATLQDGGVVVVRRALVG
jgi:hypothetical protein